MKYPYLMIIGSFLYAQELNVEGDMKVSGNLSAENNRITNVGDPIEGSDAVNLNFLNELSDLKIERIYSYTKSYSDPEFNITVPVNKIWYISAQRGYSGSIDINNIFIEDFTNGFLMADDVISIDGSYHITIYEYSYMNSGTDQGMNYIEP